MKLLTIVGARPQFIKAATLSRELRKDPEIDERILHTGQHFDANMSDIFFSELGMDAPTYNLGIHATTHGAMTGRMMIEIEQVLMREKPDLALVFGDTDSTLAGALAAAKLHIPIAHVEAGLRSFNRAMPEEINRVVTDHVADLLFAPTPTAVQNLQAENRPESSIIHCGDIMFDAALHACAQVDEAAVLETSRIEPKGYTLATLHRAENTDDPDRLLTWLRALNQAAEERPLLLPLHPRTRNRIDALGKVAADFPKIRFMDPVGYTTMAVLTKNAALVVTDSGGLQKEAYFHKVPGLILRNETEWVELVESGWSQLVECNKDCLLEALKSVEPVAPWNSNLFGDGQTAQRVAGVVGSFLS
ncbi:MAG: non-hydrolyzing UDP-N-acetylglucosamine 2-epimerase [Puniceicoccaceae bacterium]